MSWSEHVLTALMCRSLKTVEVFPQNYGFSGFSKALLEIPTNIKIKKSVASQTTTVNCHFIKRFNFRPKK